MVVSGESSAAGNFYNGFGKLFVSLRPEELKKGPPVTLAGSQYNRGEDYIIIDPSEFTQKVLEVPDHVRDKPLGRTEESGYFISDNMYRESETLWNDGTEHKKCR